MDFALSFQDGRVMNVQSLYAPSREDALRSARTYWSGLQHREVSSLETVQDRITFVQSAKVAAQRQIAEGQRPSSEDLLRAMTRRDEMRAIAECEEDEAAAVIAAWYDDYLKAFD